LFAASISANSMSFSFFVFFEPHWKFRLSPFINL